MVNKLLRRLLTHPLARDADLDSPDTTILRSRILEAKPFLKHFYRECYESIAISIPQDINGPVLELGSGAGFLNHYIPDVITSELLRIPNVDIVLDGQHLAFSENSLKAIVMMDVFHHIPNVKMFFEEAAYAIKPGGVITMIEPWVTKWSSFVYKYLHHEPYEPLAEKWILPPGGPLSQANSALPWIILNRDRQKFDREFPEWKLKKITLHSPLCYLLSGGLSFRSLMPGRSYKLWREFENILQPWMTQMAMFATITIMRA